MHNTWSIARHELLLLRRDRLFLVLLLFLIGAALLSVVVAAAAYRGDLEAYHSYVQQLRASGSSVVPAAPQLFALQQLRGAVEYLEILGALLAIVLGYGVIASEKHRHTLPLLATRPLGQFSMPAGKLVGLAIVWLIVVGTLIATATLVLLVVGTAPVIGADTVRILLVGVVAWVYLMLWSSAAMAITAVARQPSTALVVSIVIWLLFVLIIPQIGDTMDPDNQVPGGLFATLGIPKAQEHAVLAHFSAYDTLRNGLEMTSVTKHFERLSFALLGIKSTYTGQSLSFIWHDMHGYGLALLTATVVMIAIALATTTRHTLLRRTS